jgi:hypothetical protein
VQANGVALAQLVSVDHNVTHVAHTKSCRSDEVGKPSLDPVEVRESCQQQDGG